MSKRCTIEECQNLVKEHGECLSFAYIKNETTYWKWKCSDCRHEWSAPCSSIINGSWCSNCYGNKKHTIQDCNDLAKLYGGTFISEKYTNARDNTLMWKCGDCFHEFPTSYNSVQQGSWCPDRKKKTEAKVRKLLENKLNSKFPTKRFDSGKWEIDCYCKELKLGIEYDGEQHYFVTTQHWDCEENFTKRQARDRLKNERCIELGITLLRVPYWESENLETYITQLLKDNNLL